MSCWGQTALSSSTEAIGRLDATEQRFRLVSTNTEDHIAEFADDVRRGLTASPKSLPCRYFYDEEGSALFEAICELPEYYLTRTETRILVESASDIAGRLSGDLTLVELGSGSAVKTQILIEQLLDRRERLRYVAVDISSAALREGSERLLSRFAQLSVVAVAAEYETGLEQVGRLDDQPRLVLWLGSNIGNFDRREATEFLRRVGENLTEPDKLLVGIDLRKSAEVLKRAYDDEQGVTANFNLNILAHINRQFGGQFDLGLFEHHTVYDEAEGRIEMYLVSRQDQTVDIEQLELTVRFVAGETICTEYSYKYSEDEIASTVAAAGFMVEAQYFDVDRLFSLNLLTLRKTIS